MSIDTNPYGVKTIIASPWFPHYSVTDCGDLNHVYSYMPVDDEAHKIDYAKPLDNLQIWSHTRVVLQVGRSRRNKPDAPYSVHYERKIITEHDSSLDAGNYDMTQHEARAEFKRRAEWEFKGWAHDNGIILKEFDTVREPIVV
mgnify:FL=1